ncbi:WGR domain-containing protein [Mesorhizobium sp. M1E.F.Ca.ET.041.01.1.1]|nr:WGR domain-containing protein [Mesorhizobium sp. M1E.F.Ca.ET.041.01.1.1]
MIAQLYRLCIEGRDADRNMARFYALSIEETLFRFGGARPAAGRAPTPM